MTTENATVMPSRTRETRPRDMKRSAWLLSLSLFVVAVVIGGVLFLDTWRTLLHTWTSIATYNYGPIVLLLCVWLVVRMRSHLMQLTPTPSLWGVAATVIVSLTWAIGNLAGVLVMQQFAVLALIPSAALAVFGTNVFRLAAFPFLFLLFALPVGEFLIPRLITWTADFSVMTLELVGVPVFRDGPYMRIPAGDFHVVKACSGIRYLLTSVVLGALFAYLSFRSWRRRAAFLFLCLVVPIVANWVRASGIILIAHLSDMELATGIDHFIYGWVFFGLVMLIIFLIGSRFRDGELKMPSVTVSTDDPTTNSALRVLPVVAVFIGVVVAVPTGVLISNAAADRASENSVHRKGITLPSASAAWAKQDTLAKDWNPVFVGARLSSRAEYQNGTDSVSVMAVFYDIQTQGAELVSAQNSLYEPVMWWTTFNKEKSFGDEDAGVRLPVREVSVNDGQRNRLIWSWYSISGSEVSSEFLAKLTTFRALLSGDGSGAFLVALAVDYDEDIEQARGSLERFLGEYLQQFRHCLDAPVDGGDSNCE